MGVWAFEMAAKSGIDDEHVARGESRGEGAPWGSGSGGAGGAGRTRLGLSGMRRAALIRAGAKDLAASVLDDARRTMWGGTRRHEVSRRADEKRRIAWTRKWLV